MYSTTTLERIAQLESERQQLMSRLSDDGGTAEERARLKTIGRDLIEEYWPQRRAEQVLAEQGPPRMISDAGAMPSGRPRLQSYGIAPLPSGGD